jgi:hypothetical protein
MLLLAPWLVQARVAIFYQPQTRDRAVAQEQWQPLFAQLRQQGFDTLVVQWTQYGDAFGDPSGHAWLLQRIRDAHQAGLQVVLGLYSDPAFFDNQKMATDALDGYFRLLAKRNSEVAKRWHEELMGDMIDGWYLPIEIDDRRWADPAARKPLLAYLAAERKQLDLIAQRPIYVTSFFGGGMTPSSYAALLDEAEHSGVRVWVQDGAGTLQSRPLTPAERGLFLDAVSRCDADHVHGIVYEAFRQVSKTPFSAMPLPRAESGAVLSQRAPCGGDSLYFELRYLPQTPLQVP